MSECLISKICHSSVILMYKLVHCIVQRCLDLTISLILFFVICHDFMICILKSNSWSFKHEFFCGQNHGKSNKLPIKIIVYYIEFPLNIMV